MIQDVPYEFNGRRRTDRQELAHKLVVIDGLPVKEAAREMGVVDSAIRHLLRRHRRSQFKHSERSEEAYRFVFVEGRTMEEAGILMGISRQRVGQLIKKMRRWYPSLRIAKRKGTLIRIGNWKDFEEMGLIRDKW